MNIHVFSYSLCTTTGRLVIDDAVTRLILIQQKSEVIGVTAIIFPRLVRVS